MTPFLTRCLRFAQSLIQSHLEGIFRLTCQRPALAVAVSLLLLLLSSFSILNIRFESDIFKLFPAEKGALRLFIDSLEWTGGAGEAYFLLEGDRDRLVGEAEAFAGRLRAIEIDGKPGFSKVAFRVIDPNEMESFARFLAYASAHPQLFLHPDDSDKLLAALTGEGMDRALRRAGAELASGSGIGARELVAADPLYLRDLILPRLKQGSRSFDLDPESPYFISRDGRLLIMIATTARPVRDMAFARKLVAGINGARAGAGVAISCAGAHLSAVIDEAEMKHNIVACVASSLLVVLGLFYLTYRRVMPTLLIPLIILVGTVLALGTAGLFLSSIHIISFAFTALIIGLGTDYSIHLYDRFHSERLAGLETMEALRLAVMDSGHGVFTAATTTALPFLALTFSEVRALSELGLLVGLGVIFSMYATFFFLPPLLLWNERSFPAKYHASLPGLGMERLWRLTGRYANWFRGIALTLVALSAVAALRVSFEGELKNLQPRHSEALLTQEKIERHLSLAPRQLLVAVEGKNLDEVFTRGERVGELAEQYRRSGKLAAVSWLGQALNLPSMQKGALNALAPRLSGRQPDMELARALERNGFDKALFGELMTGLGMLSSGKTIPVAQAVEQLRQSPLKGMMDRYLVERDGRFHLLFHLHYRGEEFARQDFLRELGAIDPTARVTGPDLISSQLSESVRSSFIKGALLGGILVLVLLLLHFESLAGIAASLLPVLAGVVAMLGVMALTGMRLNFMNSMVLVTILGMGSDYGLHVYHRAGVRGKAEAELGFVQSGRAVLLSALTTIAGFGSLAFTDYGAMSSIGWATNYGVGATALFSLVFLPAFLRRNRT